MTNLTYDIKRNGQLSNFKYNGNIDVRYMTLDDVSKMYHPSVVSIEYIDMIWTNKRWIVRKPNIFKSSGNFHILLKIYDDYNTIYVITELHSSKKNNISNILLEEYGLKVIGPNDRAYKKYLELI